MSEYGRRDKSGHWHANTVENFFSIFKRGIIGIYHHVSEAHLSRYAAEFDSATITAKRPMVSAPSNASRASSVSARPIGGLTHSQPDIEVDQPLVGERRKRWTDS